VIPLRESRYFILWNELGAKEVTVEGELFRAVGSPLSKHYSKMIGTVIEEGDKHVEIVLHQDGIVMVTKVIGEQLAGKKGTVEYFPKNGRLCPIQYCDTLDKLQAGYIQTFNQPLNKFAEKTVMPR
jgi:hypothetical protein